MSLRTPRSGLLLGICLCMAAQASAAQPADLLAANALQAIAASSTARMVLPAIRPVPGEAGFRSTLPPPNSE